MAASPKPNGDDDLSPEAKLLRTIFGGDPSGGDTTGSMPRPANETGGPIGPTHTDRSKLIHNEQTKLTATLLNGIALSFIVGGGVTTLLGLSNQAHTGLDPIVLVLIWLLAGFILHMIARLFLRSLL